MRRTISDGRTSSTSANSVTVRIVGLRSPRSTKLMYVRSRPAVSPSRSLGNIARFAKLLKCPPRGFLWAGFRLDVSAAGLRQVTFMLVVWATFVPRDNGPNIALSRS